jgi:hypothetical protein
LRERTETYAKPKMRFPSSLNRPFGTLSRSGKVGLYGPSAEARRAAIRGRQTPCLGRIPKATKRDMDEKNIWTNMGVFLAGFFG